MKRTKLMANRSYELVYYAYFYLICHGQFNQSPDEIPFNIRAMLARWKIRDTLLWAETVQIRQPLRVRRRLIL